VARKAPQMRPLLTAAQAAAYLGFTKRQLRRWIAEDKLPIDPPHKINGRNYFEPEALDRWRAALNRPGPNVRV
jgi:excisionase family DNA binding protein